jgi:7,8-dihydropterin-6-yl-methyl-4-(beta-D-ribofuranosyl)aminobenzene 5'-phosphate synthase
MSALILMVASSILSWPMVSENKSSLRAVIVYDNNHYDDRLKTDWGFSCYIQGLEKTILFDTGGRGEILVSNLEKMGLSPENIEVVVLSHYHGDHTGGLDEILRLNPRIEVWVPEHFPKDFKQRLREKGSKIVEVSQSRKICPGTFTSGVIEGPIREQSLVIDTDHGLVIITGCAHPGIVKILSEIKESFKKSFYLVFGGFHLGGSSRAEIESIISRFKALGVKKVGPTHCSGDLARNLFSEKFGEDFIRVGAGKEIIIKRK